MAKAGEGADNRLSEHKVINALRELTVEETKKLVHQLGVKLSVIDDIHARHCTDMPKEHLVQKWLDGDTSASWEKLVSALRDIGKDNLADDIERSHVPRAAITSSTSSDSRVRRGHAASLARSSIDDFDHRVRVLLCGDSKVGKTRLISQLTKGHLKDTNTTVTVEWKVKLFCIGGRVIRMEILDTPGNERMMPLTAHHFKEAQGIMVMYDITNDKSFQNVAEWMREIRRNTVGTVPIALVGNKIDLESKRKISREEGEGLAERYGVRFFETSALHGQGVEEPFMSLHSQDLEAMIKDVQSEQSYDLMAQAAINFGDGKGSSERSTRKKWCCFS